MKFINETLENRTIISSDIYNISESLYSIFSIFNNLY